MEKDLEDAPKTLPFKAEYAKSARAKCKGCKDMIDKDDLRLAKMTKSPFFDGMQPNWYHYKCFFAGSRPKTVGDIAHFESLRYEDQQRIRKEIEVAHPTTAKEGKRTIKEFSVEYAKSSKAKCLGCDNPIGKQVLRVGKIDYDAEVSTMYGVTVFRWYHLDCFVEVREGLEFFVSGTEIPGYRDLQHEDQALIKQKLPLLKKRKLKGGSDGAKPSKMSKADIQLEKEVKKQSQAMYKLRDEITKALEKKGPLKAKHLKEFLKYNEQEVPSGPGPLLDRLTDIMIHGALKKCTVCKTGQYTFRSGYGYYCLGQISEFAKCASTTDDPERVPFRLPKDLDDDILEAFPFLAQYKKGKVQKRVIPKHDAPVAGAAAMDPTAGPSDNTLRSSAFAGPRLNYKPLRNFRFVLDPSISTDDLKEKIKQWGGSPLSTLKGKDIAAVISTKDKVKNEKDKFSQDAKARGLPVVSLGFLDALAETGFNLEEQIQKNLIGDWFKPNDVKAYLTAVNNEYERKPEEREKGKSRYEKEMKKVKLKMKNGAVVDPDSELDTSGHVYKEGNKFYTAVLNKVDVDEGRNSYYKLQLIESDHGNNYYVFRSWGRLGTTIGGNKVEPLECLEDAKELFYSLYREKAKSEFGQPFEKRPGAYVPMDIDFGEKKQMEKIVPDLKNSKLELKVQQLVCKIFDVDTMKKTLLEFELDLEKMPLGKISRDQIMKAYTALNDAMKLLEVDEVDKKQPDKRKLIEVTNRFFTLVPHNFGAKDVPLLRDVKFVKERLDMLDNLLEIELAYELRIKGESDKDCTPVDSQYNSLNCGIKTLEKSCELWKILDKYLQNTHAPTHTGYKLELVNIFGINRKGENKRFKPFANLHNRKLLWHGSRTSNFGGILSQGLRIAPPEAPVTGYMFGKGVYFADMVSKSANYCYINRSDRNTGLLLLCEVALGDMAEFENANDRLTKAPKGKHSVKGLGGTVPDPKDEYMLPTGAVIPYGKPTKSSVKNSSLLYNEYIVYDTAQVNILYLVEVRFKYN